jgi:hypothetical protein
MVWHGPMIKRKTDIQAVQTSRYTLGKGIEVVPLSEFVVAE